MMLKNLKRIHKRVISTFLCIAVILGTCVIPGIVQVGAQNYLYSKYYDFSPNGSTQCSNAYITDSNGINRQISRGFFGINNNGELEIINDLKASSAGPSGYLFNDEDGLFELKNNSNYTVSLRVKVVSAQKHFDKNGVTYPVSSQQTELKLAYGMPATYASNKITMDTEIGLIAKVGTETNVFTADQNGSVATLNVGEWYTLTYDFTTPATFGENGNVLGLALKSFNGVHILIDDVNIQMLCSITVDPGVGTISQTSFPHKIGDKISIENPTYKFGYDFEGWFTDKACTKEFTDQYVTEDNCEIKLYAGWSETHFSFEGYTPVHPTYGFNDHFYDIIKDETAPDGNSVLQYHYTEEYWSQIRSGSVEEGNVVYYSGRRTQLENNISLKRVESYKTYVVTFKYKLEAGSGDVYIAPATGSTNIWHTNVYKEYTDSKLVLTDNNPDVWQEGRIVFTTGDVSKIPSYERNIATLRFYALNHVHTVAYIDDIRIEEAEGDTSVKLNSNGGTFADGSTVKTQTVTVGDDITSLEYPIREDYDFGGWYENADCTKPIKSETIDSSVYLNTLYAGWSVDMGFEGYYYDLNSANRENYLSNNVEIIKENPKNGHYSAKLTNKNSNKQHVIALNPIKNNNISYLISFNYSLSSASSPINVKFATMNYNINNKNEVKVYEPVYTINPDDTGKGYLLGTVIIDTAFTSASANRLVMLVSSDSSADYTVYFDNISVESISDNEGYIVFTDEITGEHNVAIGKNGEEVELYEPKKAAHKFLGWYTDRALTKLYDGGKTYSNTLTRLYAKWAVGEGFDNYTAPISAITLVKEDSNSYISLSSKVTFKIATVATGKKYGVELKYYLSEATGNVVLTVDGESYTVRATEVGTGWNNHTFVVDASSGSFNLSVSPLTTATIFIDDIIVYEIDDNMSVITFDQNEDFGEDTYRVGAKGLTIDFPFVPVNDGNVFYGWYINSDYTDIFGSKVYPENDITVYARWAKNHITNITFDDLDADNPPFNENNSNTVYLEGTVWKEGKYSIAFDRQSEDANYETYVPLANKDGYIKLESNTTYAVSFRYFYSPYTSSAKMPINFFCSSADSFSNNNAVGKPYTATHSYSAKYGYTYITTGELNDNENVLYIAVTGGTKKTTLYLDSIKLTRVDEGRNHVFAYEDKNKKVYEIDGNCGEPINFPAVDTEQYKIIGWCNDIDVTDVYESVHKEEKITFLYGRWELKPIDFDYYEFENSDSKYTVGDDISLTDEYAYDTRRSLKYSYAPAIKYFETSNNVASMGRVNDKSTYRISFYYKLTETQGDVDIKFLTANLTNRWAFITNYDEATYTINSGEVGNDWKRATTYLTVDFETIGASGLFFTFNPRIEGDTVLYIDNVEIEFIGSKGVAAFLGKDGNAVMYVEGEEGDTVVPPEAAPASQFAKFNGWYSDKELTEKFTSLKLTSGMNYIYSSWDNNKESFDNYSYASSNSDIYSNNNIINDGVLTYTAKSDDSINGFRIGKIANNTSYKVTFDYKADSPATIKFASADEMSLKKNATYYNDQGNFIEVNENGSWNTATLYFTSSFTYSVPLNSSVDQPDNKNAKYGDMLYMLIIAEDGAKISIDNISLKEVKVLYSGGSSVLTEEASKVAGNQAMRFYFSYPTDNVIGINIDGSIMNVIERGIIFKNARNSATAVIRDNTALVSPVILENKDNKGHTYISKKSGFNNYWSYDNTNERLIYSGYIKDFAQKDSRLISARGYIKVRDENKNVYTFYSTDEKTTVKDEVSLNSEITNVSVHTFAGVTWENFTIVNPKLMPYIYGQQIEKLMEYAKEAHNVEIPRINEKGKETTYEIVIGNTTRSASSLVSVENADQYVIAVRGTKVIIKGGNDLATMQGVKDFIAYLKLKDSLECGADLKDGYTKYGKVSKTADDYALTFNDEFNGTALDSTIWGAYRNEKYPNTQNSPSQLGGKITMYVPGDPGYVTATGRVVEKPVYVSNGNAVLTCGRTNDKDFTFNRMSTYWNMIYQYGMLEFNIKLPEHPVHTSLWMNGSSTGGNNYRSLFGREGRGCMTEYDLIETYGRLNYFGTNVHHWWTSTGMNDNGHTSLGAVYSPEGENQTYVPEKDELNISDNYHIFTFLWTNDTLEFAFDGVKYCDYPRYYEYYDRMANYIIIGMGMGNRDYGSKYDIENHSDYYESYLDYVRLYQIENMGSVLNWANNNPNK